MYKYLYVLLSVNAKKRCLYKPFFWIIYILKRYALEYEIKENT
jgi:hypothetical protein